MQEEMIELLGPKETAQKVESSPLSQYLGEPAKRFGEAVLGAPGTVENLLTKGVQYVTGMQPSKVPGVLDIGKAALTGTRPETSENFFPMPEDIRAKVTEPLFGKPNKKDMYSNWLEDTASTAGSLFAGIVPGIGGMKAAKAFTLSGIGNTIKDLSKLVGAGEGTQELIKTGTMIAADIFGTRQNFIKNMHGLYDKAGELAAGKSTHAARLNKYITEQRKGLGKLVPEDRAIIEGILDTAGNLITGKGGSARAEVTDIWNLKKRLNDMIQNLRSSGKPQKTVISRLESINDNLREILQEFGNKNPEFKNTFNTAESMYAGLNERSQINKMLQKHVSMKSLKNPIVAMLVGGSILGPYKPAAFMAGAAAYGAKETVQLAEFLYNSPEARKLYAQTLKAAAKENVPAMNKYVKKLDEKASKYFGQGPDEEMIELL